MLKPQLEVVGSKLEKPRGLKERNRTKVELVLNRYGRRFDFGKRRGCFCKTTRPSRDPIQAIGCGSVGLESSGTAAAGDGDAAAPTVARRCPAGVAPLRCTKNCTARGETKGATWGVWQGGAGRLRPEVVAA
jgi:hypothetical protein